MDDAVRIEKTTTRAQLLVGGQPFLMLDGKVHNSSSSSLDYMKARVWPRLAALNCNTAIVPISWEQVETTEGRFDFALVDGLLAQARDRHMRLALLWFGTWKNAQLTYAPAWVKTDGARFPRAELRSGVRANALSSVGGEWRSGRRLNGDEYGIRLEDAPSVRRAKLYRYS